MGKPENTRKSEGLTDDAVEQVLAHVADGGPHEWGYRDPVTGDFIADDWPFKAADALDAKDRTIERLQAEVERLRDFVENITSRKPREERLGNELPFRCRVCGYRGFVTGEERHADDCAYVLACAALKGQTP